MHPKQRIKALKKLKKYWTHVSKNLIMHTSPGPGPIFFLKGLMLFILINNLY